MKQASFLPSLTLKHGGDVREGKRKIARPFTHKHALHLVFRSSRARGKWSFLTRENEKRVNAILRDCARRYGIRVYRFVNVGNHLHLLVKCQARAYSNAKRDFQGFARQFAGAVAFQITGASKVNAQGRFWDKTFFSRILSWGREFKRVTEYFTKNFFESQGLWTGSWDPFEFAPVGIGPPAARLA